MPSLARPKARILALVFIVITSLRSTISHPIELGEGESARESNDFNNPFQPMPLANKADSYSYQYPIQLSQYSYNPIQFQSAPGRTVYQSPFQQITYLDGSNVQINYEDEKNPQMLTDTEINDVPFSTSGQHDGETHNNENQIRRSFDDDSNKMLKNVNNLSDTSGKNTILNYDYGRQEVEHRGVSESPRIQLVTPKYVAKLILAPVDNRNLNDDPSIFNLQHDPREAAVVRKTSVDDEYVGAQQDMNVEKYQPSDDEDEIVPLHRSDYRSDELRTVVIPTQDVGENFGNEDEDMAVESSNNIAYSYSHFVPNYQPAPARYSESNRYTNNEVAPMSFVFHPSASREPQPELVLHQLNSLALQLSQSPIMNALFSPLTVPVPQNPPAWPSRYEAAKYLPPPNDPAYQQYQDPNLRRSLVQVKGVSPEILEKLQSNRTASSRFVNEAVQEYLGPNVNAFDQFMRKSMRIPEQQAAQAFGSGSQIFARGSQAFDQGAQAFDKNSAALNNFFNNQLQLPQFPNFPSFTQYQYRGYVAPSVRGITPNFPQFNPFSVPYISPSLRNIDLDPTDDIDVRMDSRPDSVYGNNMKHDSQNGVQLIQIGNGNRNFYDVLQNADEDGDEQANANENVDAGDTDQKPEVIDVGVKLDEVADDEIKNDENSDQNMVGNIEIRDNFEDVVDETTVMNDGYTDPSTYDMVAADAHEGALEDEASKQIENANTFTSENMKNDEMPIMNQKGENENENVGESEIGETSDVSVLLKLDDEPEGTTTVNKEFTTQPLMLDEVTTADQFNDQFNDDATTTDPSELESTTEPFSLDNRIDPNAIRTLAG